MEVLAGAVNSVVTCLCISTMDEYRYMKNTTEQFEIMRSKKSELIAQRDDILMKLRIAEVEHGRKPTNQVQNWLNKVEDVVRDIDVLEEAKVGKRCLILPNCCSRIDLGKRVSKMIEKVGMASKNAAQFLDESLAVLEPEVGMKLLTSRIVGKTTAANNLEMLWGCLLDNDVSRIGVYGMGGIGKTTILKEINNRLVERERSFSKVIWVTVSQNTDIRKLQDDIAKELSLHPFMEQDEVRRSRLLLRNLEKRTKFVLILDDMWKAFSLHDVGIPEPDKQNGCKLVLSTRSSEVCHMMECQVIVEVDLLSEDEAWDLFVEKIGKPLTPEITDIGKVVVKECACLPLAIITTAGSLRGKNDIREWRVALNDLRNSTSWVVNLEDRVYNCLKLSYDHLENDILKRCFLSCAMYPEDWNIQEEELVDYWIMVGLFEGSNRQDELNRGHILLNKLKYCCMLERSKVPGRHYDAPYVCVKMHDSLRDMAIRIASSPQIMIKAGIQLGKLPDLNEWGETLERASLMHNNIVDASISPFCSRLSTLLLQGNPLSHIVDHFFMNLQGLRVLNLSETYISVLPNSISYLGNLNALLLCKCKDLVRLPSLAKLRCLKVLDLNGTSLSEMPQGMEALVNLKRLDLRHTCLKGIPTGIISKLTSLQELQLYYVDDIYVPGGDEGMEFVEELLRLTYLENISLSFRYMPQFNRYIGSEKFGGLNNFAFDVVSVSMNRFFQPAKDRAVFVSNGSHSIPDKELLLPQNTMCLYISEFDDLKSLSELRCLMDVSKLREIQISCCSRIEYISSSENDNRKKSILLQQLEVLQISDCPKLFTIYKGLMSCGTLSSLKELRIWKCSNLKYLFSSMLLTQLKNLVNLSVQSCEELEEIIASEDTKDEGSCISNIIDLPMLRKIYFSNLPKLKMMFARSLQHFPSLEEVYVSCCKQMEELISEEERIILPSLNTIHFRDLKLKNIWNRVTAFHSLRVVRLWDCNEITTLFPMRLAQQFGFLEEIHVFQCTKLEEIIAEDMTGQRNSITLPRLRELKLWCLPRLNNIWKGVVMCDSLQIIEIHQCDELKRLPQFSGKHQSPPACFKQIRGSQGWWDSLEWDYPYVKYLLQPLCNNDPCIKSGRYRQYASGAQLLQAGLEPLIDWTQDITQNRQMLCRRN